MARKRCFVQVYYTIDSKDCFYWHSIQYLCSRRLPVISKVSDVLIQYYPRADLSPIHFFISLSILSRAILSTPQKLKLGRINIQDKTTVNYSCYVMPWVVTSQIVTITVCLFIFQFCSLFIIPTSSQALIRLRNIESKNRSKKMKTVPKAVKSNLDINSKSLQKKYKKVPSCYRFSCYYRFSDIAINSVNPSFI